MRNYYITNNKLLLSDFVDFFKDLGTIKAFISWIGP